MIRLTRLLGLMIEWTCHGVPWLLLNFLWFCILWSHVVEFPPHKTSLRSGSDWTFKTLSFPPNSNDFRSQWISASVLMFALLFDLSMVGLMKGFIRRPRPVGDCQSDMWVTVPLDAWSFPSGHSSRAVLLLFLLPHLFYFALWQLILLIFWTAIVCLSRYAMRRHHLTDILAGVVLGFLEYRFVMFIDWPIVLSVLTPERWE